MASRNFLEFERPIGELMAKVDELRHLSSANADLNIAQEITLLEEKARGLTEDIFAKLSPWQKTLLSRHPDRPYTSDYLEMVFDDFRELHGDRAFADDKAIIGGLARIDGRDVMVIGQEKGRGTKEKVERNFGMPRPEGYRKALRLMKMAEKFRLPIICLIDTQGAYPGKGAEQRGQAEAIARNLKEMAQLTVPMICVVIGEGGSGGALAIGMGNRVYMMQYAIYSVISPEGCASILWKDAAEAPRAAEAMRLTADEIRELGVIDGIIAEPTGGAHRDPKAAAIYLKRQILGGLSDLDQYSPEGLAQQRFDKYMALGQVLEN
ncbi:acetyl-CoA carboxylase carboxyl transferase subunit alpha [Magnetofaba australis]|uniref:Acetyl-coenzyme A carboxylase carboxyl transferase subunit alpha n=1 Tax=Magnetofaba australis IT-1 TaxID=1434232 RepID=A0A1Y2KC62_9PROT|nr:acetyl-CoA carboxylase carboxyl transferase subunit alpha [Magnetofaba australis]OSM08440.1 putative acetyl-coenzyme A carboxylase carboxyl transferase subunit alpha [Magnetofaba australis IT-1]